MATCSGWLRRLVFVYLAVCAMAPAIENAAPAPNSDPAYQQLRNLEASAARQFR